MQQEECSLIIKMPSSQTPKARRFNVWIWKKNELGFFRIPDLNLKLQRSDPNPTGLVKVTGGL
jgi:hypothetical protein